MFYLFKSPWSLATKTGQLFRPFFKTKKANKVLMYPFIVKHKYTKKFNRITTFASSRIHKNMFPRSLARIDILRALCHARLPHVRFIISVYYFRNTIRVPSNINKQIIIIINNNNNNNDYF